jgi:hypothetical protein
MKFRKTSITFKFTLEELENIIEVYSRQPHDEPLENQVRTDLKNIRLQVEKKINEEKKSAETRPSEEERLTSANPTSVEHTK